MSIFTIPDWSKGVNKDLLPSELPPGTWSDCANFRFRSGFAELWRGVQTLGATAASPVYWASSYASSTLRFAVYLGSSAYSFGTGETNITRFTEGATIASITFVGTTATVTTSVAHGRTTGDNVTHYAALPSQYNATGNITVTGATTYTYTMATAPATNATTVGAYSYNVTSLFTATNTGVRWTGGAFNGVFLASNKNDGLHYWDGNTSNKFRKMPLATVKADSVRPFNAYIVSLIRPHSVSWSSAAAPGAIPSAFAASSTNDAGTLDLAETPGYMVDSLPLGDTNIIYKQDARYAQRHIDGQFVFSFTRLPGTDGLLAPGCVVDTPVGHVFLTNDLDVMVHQGGAAKSIAVGRIKAWISSTMRSFAYCQYTAFLAANPDRSEVWVCFPGSTSTNFCTKAAVWNWESDTWGIFDFLLMPPSIEVAYAAPGLYEAANYPGGSAAKQVLFVVGADTALSGFYKGLNLELGNYFGTIVNGSLERTGMDFGNRDFMKAIQRSRWNIKATAGNKVDIYHGSHNNPGGAATYAAATPYTVGTTNYVNARASMGRYGAVKLAAFSGTGSPTGPYNVEVRSSDLDVTLGGKR